MNFGLSCLNKNCSKFVQILDPYFGSKKPFLPKQKRHHTRHGKISEKSLDPPHLVFEKLFKVENLGFWPVLAAAEA